MKAKWPDHGEVDWNLLKQNEFVVNTIYNFRLKLDSHSNPKKGLVSLIFFIFIL